MVISSGSSSSSTKAQSRHHRAKPARSASLSSYSLATQGTSRVQPRAHATSCLKALVACAMRRKSIVGDLRSDALASINSPQAYCGGLFDMQSLSIPVGGTTRCTSYSCDPESERLPNRSVKSCELYKTISPKPPISKARSRKYEKLARVSQSSQREAAMVTVVPLRARHALRHSFRSDEETPMKQRRLKPCPTQRTIVRCECVQPCVS